MNFNIVYVTNEIACGCQKLLFTSPFFVKILKMFEQNNKATAKLITLVPYIFNVTIEAKHILRESNSSNI